MEGIVSKRAEEGGEESSLIRVDTVKGRRAEHSNVEIGISKPVELRERSVRWLSNEEKKTLLLTIERLHLGFE